MFLTTEHGAAGAVSYETLALQAQRGNKAALDALLAGNRVLAEKYAAHCIGVSLETDDFVQEAMLALLSAAYTYEPQKNASFKTYATVCIKNRLRSIMRAEAAAKNAPLNTYLPLEGLQLTNDTDPERQLISEEDTQNLIGSIERLLSPLEKKVLLCRLEGLSYFEISARLHITEKSTNNALQRVRVKLKKFQRS